MLDLNYTIKICSSVSMSRQHYRSNWSSYTPSHIDSSLVTNIHKLFSERIEIFSSVQFNKASILTGIIKISLKVMLIIINNFNNNDKIFYLILFNNILLYLIHLVQYLFIILYHLFINWISINLLFQYYLFV